MNDLINPPFNYTGSKFKLLNQILPLMDYSKSHFVDLFSGGGSVYVNLLNKFDSILVNDIISDLIEIQKEIIKGDEIIEIVKSLCPGKNNKEGYYSLRDSYNSNPSPDKLWSLMLSCGNNMMRFNKSFKFNQTYGDRGWNESTSKKLIPYIEIIRKFKDKINYLSHKFHEIPIRENTMYYCDPPYGRIKSPDGNMSNKQISEAGYNCYWDYDDDIKLYEYLHNINKIGSSFMVSGVLEHNGNISWMLDKLINDGFYYKEIECDYDKVSKKGKKSTKEIIILNYEPKN